MMDRWSLISGALPWLIAALAFAALAIALTRWPHRELWKPPIVLVASIALLVGISYWWRLPQKLHGTWPPSFFVWCACPVAALWLAVSTWRGGQVRHRVAGVVAVVMLTALAADRINIYYGAVPTVGDAFGTPLPGEIAQPATVERAAVSDHLPASGVVFPLHIAGTVSHFRARSDFVWLPPVWFSRPRPHLPALELVSGTPSFTGDWLRGGRAVDTLDAYAAAHHGWGPIVVVADQNGSFLGDTECVNGPRGHADTYVSVDVVRKVDRLFDVARGPRHWAIAGYSAGGTCALVMALRHPSEYAAFGDFSGDLRPSSGRSSAGLRDLYGGSTALARAYDPTLLLREHRYPGLLAWFETGRQDASNRVAAQQQLALLARRAGASVMSFSPPGTHSFYFWTRCLQRALPSLVAATRDGTRSVHERSAI